MSEYQNSDDDVIQEEFYVRLQKERNISSGIWWMIMLFEAIGTGLAVQCADGVSEKALFLLGGIALGGLWVLCKDSFENMPV